VNVVNVSTKPLLIEFSRASCTCTSVDLANTRLEPGQSAALAAEYKGSPILGARNMVVRVKAAGYNDVAEVPMTVLVALPLHSDPPKINAIKDRNTGFQPQAGVLNITSEDHKPFRILTMQGGPPPFVDFDPAKDQPRDHYKLKWDLTRYNLQTCTDSNGVMMPGWFVLETDHPDCPVLDIELDHDCTIVSPLKQGDTWLIPDRRIAIGKVTPGVPIDVPIEVRWIPKAGVREDVVKMATSESPYFKAELKEVTPTKEGFIAHVTLTPQADRRGMIYGVVRLHSNNQQWPVTMTGLARE
jgi:hypothetical protein